MEEIKKAAEVSLYAQLAARVAVPRVDAQPTEPQPETESLSPTKKADQADLDAAIEQVKDMAAEHQISLEFTVHEATGRTVIKVIDPETHKVLRQLPPEAILEAAANLEEFSGALFNSEA
ncbi:MAG: flagellar protein FlaG [Pseudomonadota bacterium]